MGHALPLFCLCRKDEGSFPLRDVLESEGIGEVYYEYGTKGRSESPSALCAGPLLCQGLLGFGEV